MYRTKLMINSVVPFAWDNSMTLYEFVGKLVTLINKQGDYIQEGIIPDVVEKLEGRLQDYTKNELELMLQNGELVNMVANYMESIAPFRSEVEEARQGELSLVDNISKIKSDVEIVERNKLNKSFPQSNIDLKHLLSYECESGYGEGTVKQGWLQGFCIVGNNIVLSRISSYQQSNEVVLTEINMSTMKMVRETTLVLGHSNDLEYYPDTNEILCTPGTMFVGGVSTSTEYIIAIDYATLTITRKINTQRTPTGIGYDKVTGELAYKNAYSVIYLDKQFNPIKTVECQNPGDNSTGQGMCLDNGLIYMNRSVPESIQVWNNKGELQKIYAIPPYTNEDFRVFETESVKPLGHGKFLVGTVKAKNSTKKISVFDFFIMDTLNKTKPANFKIRISDLSTYDNKVKTLYVDKAYTKLDSDGSYEKPFKDLQSAINNSTNPVFRYIIKITPGNYEYTEIFSHYHTINIIGGNAATKDTYVINGLQLFDSRYVYLSGVKVTKLLEDTPFRARDSEFRLTDCTIEGDGFSGGLTASNSRVWLDGANKISNCKHGFYLDNGSFGYLDKDVTFENCTHSEVYPDHGSVIRIDPRAKVSKVLSDNNGEVYHKTNGSKGAFEYYKTKGIVVSLNDHNTIEPNSPCSIDELTYTGSYYLTLHNVTGRPIGGNGYLNVTTSARGHCVQKFTGTLNNDFIEFIRKSTVQDEDEVVVWSEWKTITYA